jgi:hypothetical protein
MLTTTTNPSDLREPLVIIFADVTLLKVGFHKGKYYCVERERT